MATSLSSECIQLVETLTIQQVFFFWEVHSSHAGFILYFSSCRPTQPSSPHIILIMFLSSPASSLTGYQIISQTDSRHEAVGGDQLRPHYDLSNKNSLQGWFISDLTRWQHSQHNWTSDLRRVLVIVLVRQTGKDQARRSEIWKACYHHHHSPGRHRFYRKILHHNPCLTESP